MEAKGYKNVPQTPGFYMGNTLFICTNRKPFSLMNTGTKNLYKFCLKDYNFLVSFFNAHNML